MNPQIVPQSESNERKNEKVSTGFINVQQKRQEIRELLLLKAAKFAPASIPVLVFSEQLVGTVLPYLFVTKSESCNIYWTKQ